MFYNYKILESNNEEILYLYLSSMYEFSYEIDNSNKQKSIYDKISNYINDMDIDFNGNKIMLVVGGIIIGSITIPNNKDSKNYIKYKEIIDFDKFDNIDIIDIDKNSNNFMKDERYNISNFVKMKNNNGRITYVDLNNFLISELSLLIPPSYDEEAIKSAIIITRTKVFKELYENNFLNEENYRDINALKKLWKKDFLHNLNKFKSLIIETEYQYLTNKHYYFNFNISDKYYIPFNSYNANKLAKRGYKYIDILGHFYPNAILESL